MTHNWVQRWTRIWGGMSLVARFLWHLHDSEAKYLIDLWILLQVCATTYFLAMIFCLLADLAYLIAKKAATTPMITTNCRKDMNISRSSIYTAWVSLIISHAWHEGGLVYIFNRYTYHMKSSRTKVGIRFAPQLCSIMQLSYTPINYDT